MNEADLREEITALRNKLEQQDEMINKLLKELEREKKGKMVVEEHMEQTIDAPFTFPTGPINQTTPVSLMDQATTSNYVPDPVTNITNSIAGLDVTQTALPAVSSQVPQLFNSNHPTFTMPTIQTQPQLPQDHTYLETIRAMDQRLRAVEADKPYGGVTLNDFCLVKGVRIPPKFKLPELQKYNGTGCPLDHLRMYCRKMAHVDDEKLLMHFFQESLTEGPLKWYDRLTPMQAVSWQSMADSFLQQYSYNIGVAPTRTDLERLSKKPSETFKEYAGRWRTMAARLASPLTDMEMVQSFLITLNQPYLNALITSGASDFNKMVAAGDLLDWSIQRGLIDAPELSKKGFKKREAEVSNVQAPNNPTMPINLPTVTRERPPRDDTPVPAPLSHIYRALLQGGRIQPVFTRPLQPPFPEWYKPDVTCEFHSNVPGHSTDQCFTLKRKVQAMIRNGELTFSQPPNIQTNPLPNHQAQPGAA